jgi:hypothetical protein
VASAGDGRIEGDYRVDGNRIRFEAFTAPVPRGEESQEPLATLLAVLVSAHSWRIQEQVLELFDASGRSIAVLEAVYLR